MWQLILLFINVLALMHQEANQKIIASAFASLTSKIYHHSSKFSQFDFMDAYFFLWLCVYINNGSQIVHRNEISVAQMTARLDNYFYPPVRERCQLRFYKRWTLSKIRVSTPYRLRRYVRLIRAFILYTLFFYITYT